MQKYDLKRRLGEVEGQDDGENHEDNDDDVLCCPTFKAS